MPEVSFSLPCQLDQFFQVAQMLADDLPVEDIDAVWDHVKIPSTPKSWDKNLVAGLIILAMELAERNGISEEDAYGSVEVLLNLTADEGREAREVVLKSMYITVKNNTFAFGLTERGVELGKELHEQAQAERQEDG